MTVWTFRHYCKNQERRIKDFLARLGDKVQPRGVDRDTCIDANADDPLKRAYLRLEDVKDSVPRKRISPVWGGTLDK